MAKKSISLPATAKRTLRGSKNGSSIDTENAHEKNEPQKVGRSRRRDAGRIPPVSYRSGNYDLNFPPLHFGGDVASVGKAHHALLCLTAPELSACDPTKTARSLAAGFSAASLLLP